MTRHHVLSLAIALSAPTVASGAQNIPTDSACTYDRCAVWLDHGALRRGASGPVVMRDSFLRPMRLPAFVGGADSATIWAERFEGRARTGSTLSTVGLVSFLTGVGAYYLRTRNLGPGEFDDANGFEGALAFGGVITMAAGLILRSSAEPARNRAIWWYNYRFARP